MVRRASLVIPFCIGAQRQMSNSRPERGRVTAPSPARRLLGPISSRPSSGLLSKSASTPQTTLKKLTQTLRICSAWNTTGIRRRRGRFGSTNTRGNSQRPDCRTTGLIRRRWTKGPTPAAHRRSRVTTSTPSTSTRRTRRAKSRSRSSSFQTRQRGSQTRSNC